MIKLWEAGKIEKPLAPILPDLTLRGFGDFHLGERTADAKERDTIRKRKHSDWMADVSDNPEKYSPVVSFTDVPEDLVGQKIEVRWWVPDGEGGRYLHCFEGTIQEIIPFTESRPNYPEFRLCKHPVALVQWDEEFGYKDSHVPMNPSKYERELDYMGWNILNSEYVAAQRAAAITNAQQEEESRVAAAATSAILDIGMSLQCDCN